MNPASAAAAIPARLNMALAAVFLLLGLFQFFVLPLVLVPASAWWALLLVPCALATTANWSLVHEAIHGLFSPDRRTNDLVGRTLAIFFGAPLEALRFAHLMHHRLSGTPADRPEYYEARATSRARAALVYYPRLLFGTYAFEIAGTVVCLLPRPLLERVVRLFPREHAGDVRAGAYLLQPERLGRLRRDAMATIAIFGAGLWCYGRHWEWLLLALAARGVLVSVADNAYHYGAPLNARARSAHNLSLPFGWMILHFNLHRVHHLHPAIPWTGLPAAFRRDDESCDRGYFAALLHQFGGPLSDRAYDRIARSVQAGRSCAGQVSGTGEFANLNAEEARASA